MEKKQLYSDIITKLKELEAMNEIEPIYDFALRGSDNPNTLENIMKRQETLMNELKTIARANNTLLGREMRFPMADSYAVYVVTKVNKNSVQVTWVKYCDAWQDGRLGYEGTLDLKYVTNVIKGQDAMSDYIAQRKQQTV